MVSHPVAILFSPKLNLQLHSFHPLLLQPVLHPLHLCAEFLQTLMVLLLA